MDWTLINSSLSNCVSPLKLYKGPDRDPLGHPEGTGRTRSGPLQVKDQDPTRSRRGGGVGTLRAVQKVSLCPWRNPTGAPPSPCRTVYGLDPWYISHRARVTFKLELKVTRDPRVGEKMDGTRSGSLRVSCGTAKKRPLWNVTKAWAWATPHVTSNSHISKRYALYFNLFAVD